MSTSDTESVEGGIPAIQAPDVLLATTTDTTADLRSKIAGNEIDTNVKGDAEAPPSKRRGQMLRIFAQNKLAVLSVAILILIVLFCFVGPLLYHTNQSDANLALSQPQNLAPSWKHPFGTDSQGWDILGRVMYGGKTSLILGFFAGLITIIVGTLYGMISGLYGGIVDSIMMRILDAFLSIPYLFLLIALVSIFHNSTTFLILLIGLTLWWGNARIVRSDAILISQLDYTRAATIAGARRAHLVRHHVFPNSISNIVTIGTFSVADAILFLSSLSFVGVGIQPPDTDWGAMLNLGVNGLPSGWWWEVFPVTTVFVVVIVCLNYIGDALRDAFEVRLRES